MLPVSGARESRNWCRRLGNVPTIAKAIVRFCRFVRDRGLSAGVKESIEALRAAEAVGIRDADSLKSALRAVLCSSKQEWDKFDDLFEEYWLSGTPPGSRKLSHQARQSKSVPPAPGILMGGTGSTTATDKAGKAVSGASVHERLKKTDFSQIPLADLEELEELSRRLLRQMSMRLSRRLKM